MLHYRVEPIEWEVVYPVHRDLIGRIRRRAGRFEAKLRDEHLGGFATGDAAVEAVWQRFLEESTVRHERASRTHGAYERHVR